MRGGERGVCERGGEKGECVRGGEKGGCEGAKKVYKNVYKKVCQTWVFSFHWGQGKVSWSELGGHIWWD